MDGFSLEKVRNDKNSRVMFSAQPRRGKRKGSWTLGELLGVLQKRYEQDEGSSDAEVHMKWNEYHPFER